jgi:hypothetical protein
MENFGLPCQSKFGAESGHGKWENGEKNFRYAVKCYGLVAYEIKNCDIRRKVLSRRSADRTGGGFFVIFL